MPMTRAVRIHEYGGPEVLRLETIELAQPAAHEAIVRHTAIGLNFTDTYHRSGLYPVPQLPSGLGVEAAGVVEAVGSAVRDLQPGQRVAYATAGVGAYAERRAVPADRLLPLPDGISDEVAAAILLKGMTVEYLTRRCRPVERGETVLWHAAAGGVGLIACQWLSAQGVIVIGTAGGPEKTELARANGCAHVIDYRREDVAAQVRKLTGGRGVPVVFDSVGRTTLLESLDALAPRGLLVSFGNASGKPEPLDLGVLAQKGSLYVTRPTLGTYAATRAELLESARALFAAVEAGHVRPHIGQRWQLEDVAAAHRALEARQTIGSSLLLPG